MIKIERSPIPPASLAKAKETNGSYAERDVIDQLYEDFYEKCYLCEIDELQSAEVEHLVAHGGDPELKYSWDNLFLSCRHCNSMKNNRKYASGVMDCCKVDPERHLEYAISEGRVVVESKDMESSSIKTAELLMDCFEKRNTGIREHTCEVRVRALKTTMTLLYKTLNAYKNNDKLALEVLKIMLSRSYRFAGFTRAYVRRNINTYPDLAPYVVLEET